MSKPWEQVLSPLLSSRLPTTPAAGLAKPGLPAAGWLPSGRGAVAAESLLREAAAPGTAGLNRPITGLSLSVRLVLARRELSPAGMRSWPRGALITPAAEAVRGADTALEGDAGILPPPLPTAFPGARPLGGSGAFRRAPLVHSEWSLAESIQSPAEGSGSVACDYRTRSML